MIFGVDAPARRPRALAASSRARRPECRSGSRVRPRRARSRNQRQQLEQHRRNDVRGDDAHRRDERQAASTRRLRSRPRDPHTPLRSTFSSALPIASGSISIAATCSAPSFAAAIASTALPAPRSATRSPGEITRCSSRMTPRVVACSPVPNAMPGSMTIVRAASRSSASHGGATVRAPSCCTWSPRFHSSDQSTFGSGSVSTRASALAASAARSNAAASVERGRVRHERAADLLHALRARLEQRRSDRIRDVTLETRERRSIHRRRDRRWSRAERFFHLRPESLAAAVGGHAGLQLAEPRDELALFFGEALRRPQLHAHVEVARSAARSRAAGRVRAGGRRARSACPAARRASCARSRRARSRRRRARAASR